MVCEGSHFEKSETKPLPPWQRDCIFIKTGGEADAKATEIYGKAYGKNREFYEFYRSMNAYREALSSRQDVLVLEDKLTVTKRLKDLPDWLAVNTLGSVNYRYTKATGYRYGGDFSSHRMDLMAQMVIVSLISQFL